MEHIIICPHCKAQYLPNEIFIPKYFLGDTEDIIKNEKGEIEHFNGNTMDLHEEFTCEYCGTTFNIDATVSFNSSIDELVNFNEDYSTTIYKNRIILEESNK